MNGSEVDEGFGLRQELSDELNAEVLAESSPVPPVPGPSWLRLAYALEFLIALIAIITLWSEIGEGHLDLMPWHIKLVCIVGLAWCCVRFTAGIVEQQELWTRRTISWFVGILLFCLAMGGITYYYHLHEDPGDDGDDDTTAAAASIDHYLGIFFNDASNRTRPSIPICFVARSAVRASHRIPIGSHGRDPRVRM
jgi:hypothetical protein